MGSREGFQTSFRPPVHALQVSRSVSPFRLDDGIELVVRVPVLLQLDCGKLLPVPVQEVAEVLFSHAILQPMDPELVAKAPGKKKLRPLTDMQAAWLEHYMECGNASRAARLAGYKGESGAVGSAIKKDLADHIAFREQAKRLDPEVFQAALAEIVADKNHKDRIRAIEIGLKMHGMLSEKVDITLDRRQLVSELRTLVLALTQPPSRQPVYTLGSESVSDPDQSTDQPQQPVFTDNGVVAEPQCGVGATVETGSNNPQPEVAQALTDTTGSSASD
jgi:hypothetical protein